MKLNLLHHEEPFYVDNSEICIVSSDEAEIRDILHVVEMSRNPALQNYRIALLSSRSMSNQVSHKLFVKAAQEKSIETHNNGPDLIKDVVGGFSCVVSTIASTM